MARPLSVLAGIARAKGSDWTGILSRHGFSPEEIEDQNRKISAEGMIAVFEDVARATGNDAAVLDEFSALPTGYAYTFDYVGLLAASLRDGLQNWQRFYPLHSNVFILKYSENNAYGVLECRVPDSAGPAHQATYAFVAWIAGRIELVLGTLAAAIRLEFAAPAPKRTCGFLERHSGRASFGHAANRILVPGRFLDSRPPGADRALLKIMEDAASLDMLDRLRETSPLAEIAATIGECLKSGDCSMTRVASTVGVTQKSLQKVLERENTCFRSLLEDVRRSMAERYLVETDLAMKEIAYLLGFSEMSAFSRAAKKWFGQPPSLIRHQRRAP